MADQLGSARWIEDALSQFHRASPNPRALFLGSIVPTGFPEYARVLHPATVRSVGTPIRWSEIAWSRGRDIHPLMQFGRIAGVQYPYKLPWGLPPRAGSLPAGETREIVGILSNFTSTPDQCYFAFWEGYGLFTEEEARNNPKVVTPLRRNILLNGDVNTVRSFVNTRSWQQSPNLWWPEDRSWCVATEIDLYDTFIGGSTECIAQLLASPGLEVYPVNVNDRIDECADTINPPIH